jgi:hypothetical protein
MVTIEQVKTLEQKIGKAIEYVNGVIDENRLLKSRMDGYQKRIEELEILIQRFKEDQGKIEESIVSSLDQLNRFEDAIAAGSSSAAAPAAEAPAAPAPEPAAPAEPPAPAAEEAVADSAPADDGFDIQLDDALDQGGDAEAKPEGDASANLDIF